MTDHANNLRTMEKECGWVAGDPRSVVSLAAADRIEHPAHGYEVLGGDEYAGWTVVCVGDDTVLLQSPAGARRRLFFGPDEEEPKPNNHGRLLDDQAWSRGEPLPRSDTPPTKQERDEMRYQHALDRYREISAVLREVKAALESGWVDAWQIKDALRIINGYMKPPKEASDGTRRPCNRCVHNEGADAE